MKKALLIGAGAGVAAALALATKETGTFDLMTQSFTTAGMSDREIMARTMFGEAAGEGDAGMRAVGHVIWNRVNDGIAWNGFSVKSVCLKKWQFSTWLDHDDDHRRNKKRMLGADMSNAAYALAYRIAGEIMSGSSQDTTGGSDHYFNPSQAMPDWAVAMVPTVIIGQHNFYLSGV